MPVNIAVLYRSIRNTPKLSAMKQKAYLDTNILRQINNIPDSPNIELVGSQLGIMELISGMTSEREFAIRKSVLNSILSRDIHIIWESIATLQAKAFGLRFPYHDVRATKELMKKIVKTDSLAEANKINIELGGNSYTIDTFTQLDKSLMEDYVSVLKETQSVSTSDRLFLRNNPYSPADIRVLSEIIIVGFLSLFKIERGSPEYLAAIDYYTSNSRPLKNYINSLGAYIINAMESRNAPGFNDGHDIAHLAYTHDIDLFISDDKFYQRLMPDLFTVKFLKFNNLVSPQ